MKITELSAFYAALAKFLNHFYTNEWQLFSQSDLFSGNQYVFQKTRSRIIAIIEVTKYIREQLDKKVKDTFVSLILKKNLKQSTTKFFYVN